MDNEIEAKLPAPRFALIKRLLQEDHEIMREPETRLPTIFMLLLAFIIGILGGLSAVAFKVIIALFHNLFFYKTLSIVYKPDVHMEPSIWGNWVIFVPVIGAVLVTWITKTLAPEAKGHGVPEVLNAIYYHGGKIRPVVVIAKAIASAISIGSGGSVGREGPIIQMGSAIGSAIGQMIKMPVRQRITLIAAGAAAGIAATFNAPIGGLAFAMELLLVSISARTITLVAIATVTSTYIGRIYGGLAPSFDVPDLAIFGDHIQRLYSLLFCVPLGVLTGVVAAVFIKSIYAAEDGFAQMIKNEYLRHMLGMVAIGLMLYLFMHYTGFYYIGGVGYPTIIDVLQETLKNPAILLLLFIAKLLATDITLGSGASGGIFSPSIFLGATLGSAFGNIIIMLYPDVGVSPIIYAIAGMAAMVGGTTGAVLTAITMTFEQTRDYSIILPIILTVSIAHIVRLRLCHESIYTLKLTRRGAFVPQGLEAAVVSHGHAGKIMSTNFEIVDLEDFAKWQATRNLSQGARYVVISSGDKVIGVARDEVLCMSNDEDPESMIDKKFLSILPHRKWPEIVRNMGAMEAETVLVFNSHRQNVSDLSGIITSRELIQYSRLNAELME